MGDVAASGGYAISYRATKIVADSLTITGSIGSIYGKMNIAGAWNKIGMTFDYVTKGPNALMWSDITDFTDEQWKRMKAHHNASFDQWLQGISEARNIPIDELRPLTEGRVWTGRQAKARGLVDELGGLDKAIEVAKKEAGIPETEQVALVNYPRKRGLYYLLTSGDTPLTMVRWAVYQYLHNDVATTIQSLQHGEMRLWTGSFK
jgi:protease IV